MGGSSEECKYDGLKYCVKMLVYIGYSMTAATDK